MPGASSGRPAPPDLPERPPTDPAVLSVAVEDWELEREERFQGVSGDLRRHTARGTLLNSAFRIGISGLGFLQRMLIAVFLTPSQLGLWGLVLITLITFTFIKEAGVSDKYIQQSDPDQERAFQKAFSIDAAVTGVFVLLAAAALPVFAAIYDQQSIILPGLILLAAVVGRTLQAPTWIFYRRMNFVRQRTLEAVEPVVMFVVTISLAAAGASYWSMVVGAVAGSLLGGLVAIRFSPYRLRFAFDRKTAREYFSFSWPLVAARIGAIVVGSGSMLVGSRTVGLAGVGAIALAVSILALSDGVDAILTKTIYPAVCAVRDRADLFFEAFVKSNRLALMWGVPFGIGVALFAEDLVSFVLGEKWQLAVILLQSFGVMAALDQIGFNWTAFLRARNETRPLATVGLLMAGAFLVVTVPLMILDGLEGYAIGMLVMTVLTVGARSFFLARLFDGFSMIRHTIRAVAPVIPAVALVFALRAIAPDDRAATWAAGELIFFVVAVGVVTWYFERALIREVLGYLRRKRAPEGPPAVSPA